MHSHGWAYNVTLNIQHDLGRIPLDIMYWCVPEIEKYESFSRRGVEDNSSNQAQQRVLFIPKIPKDCQNSAEPFFMHGEKTDAGRAISRFGW